MTGWERVHPRLVLVGALWPVGPVVGVVLFDGWSLPAVITLSSLIVTGSVVAGVYTLRWATTRYRITATAFEVRSGLLFRRARSAALDRVRGVDVSAQPLHRVFGLATVVVSTAEGGVRLDGVTRARAERLRDRLRPAGGEVRLAAFDWAWLKYGPLTFWSVGGVGVAVGGAYRVLDSFGVKPYELGFVREVYFFFAGLPVWVAVGVLLLGVVVLGACGSTAWFVETWWDFRLSRSGDAFKVRRGLLTTRSMTVDRARVRGVQVTEPLLLRAVRSARTNAIAVGLGSAEDRSSAPKSALLPPAPLDLAWRVATEALGVPASFALRRHPRAALRRRLGRVPAVVLPPVAVVGGLGVWLSPFLVHLALLVGLAGLVAGTWLAFDAYRSLGHAVDGSFVVMRSGTFARRTVVLRRAGGIGWQVSQSPFQRRAGLATLTLATAAGVHAYRVHDVLVADAVDLGRWAVREVQLSGSSR
ncbi:PH domain-containing protein [Saccharothrix variisporea]|uniref:Putative membrane protein n=1 Tax=Saccharothrix variisporea TaxID=543527 RepID=A0A495X5Z9_9PSEU|nr:PH domain-containing protein [Saccharothrix variisporea]RKT68073.1 putative membrane protein [Saccharothrix variisporea]